MKINLRAPFAGGESRQAQAPAAAIRARYDNAQNTHENQRKWWMADYFSAKSANSYQVRRQLRMRCRYEVSNGPYLFGIATDNADDLIDEGPKLQCLGKSAAWNKQIEDAWNEWYAEVDGTEKLKTAKLAKSVDGEGILVLKSARTLENPVKLYPLDIEADQMTTPAPKDLEQLWIDGLVLDPITQRPISYQILKSHPGDFFFPNLNPLEVVTVPARHVVHWFDKFRPGQVRGVPAFTTSLDLFTDMRSFRRATITAAQVAANMGAALLKQSGDTAAPSNIDDVDTAYGYEEFKSVPLEHGMMTMLPPNVEALQMKPEHPATTYEMFLEKTLGEACRPLSYPLNLALGTSQKFNFSSAKLDHINYRNGLKVERAECERIVLEKLFRAWHAEARLVPGLLPAGAEELKNIPHEWHWPGFPALDPVSDADADHERLAHGTLTWREFWAMRGHDWREILAQQSEELQEIERLGLDFGDPVKRSITERAGDPASTAELSRRTLSRFRRNLARLGASREGSHA